MRRLLQYGVLQDDEINVYSGDITLHEECSSQTACRQHLHISCPNHSDAAPVGIQDTGCVTN
jgi:hypothetical protein